MVLRPVRQTSSIRKGPGAAIRLVHRINPNLSKPPIGFPSGGRRCPIPKVSVKAKGLAGKGTGVGGQALSERPKALPTSPPSGFAMLSAVPAQTVPPTAGAPPKPPPGPAKADAAGAGRIAAGCPRRQKLGTHLAAHLALARPVRHALPRPAGGYAEMVQQFPGVRKPHHAYPGGMLDHGLEIVASRSSCSSHLLPAGGARRGLYKPPRPRPGQPAPPTRRCYDIGKIAVDRTRVCRRRGQHWHGPLRRRFLATEGAASTGCTAPPPTAAHAGLLDPGSSTGSAAIPTSGPRCCTCWPASTSTPARSANWSSNPDQASVAQELGGDPSKALAAPRHALQRKLLDGLRYLPEEEFKLNQPQARRMAKLTQDALWLVSKTVSDKLRASAVCRASTVSRPKHGGVQRAGITASPGHARRQGDLEGHRHQRYRLVAQLHLLKPSPAMIWDAADRPAPFAGRAGRRGTGSRRHRHRQPTRALEAEPCHPEHGADRAHSRDNGVAALLDLLMTRPTPQRRRSLSFRPQGSEPRPSPAVLPRGEPNHLGIAGTSGRHFMDLAASGHPDAQAHHQRRQGPGAYRRRYGLPVSPGVFQRYAQEHLQIAALAKQEKLEGWRWVQKRFLRNWGCTASSQRVEYLDLRSHGAAKSRRLHGYLLEAARSAVPGDAARQPIPAAPQRGRKARKFSRQGIGDRRRTGVDKGPLRGPASIRGWA